MRLITGAIVCLALAVASAKVQAEECKTLTVTARPGYAPISWSEEGALVAVGPALVRLLVAGTDVELRLVDYGSWPEAQAAVREGRTDAIAGLLPGRAEAKRLGLEDRLAVADPRLIAEPMFLAVSRNSPCRDLVIGWRNAVSMAKQYRKIDALLADAEEAWASRRGEAVR